MKTRIISMLLAVITLISVFSVVASAADVASGTCGSNISWSLSDKGVLALTGSGKMNNYSYTDGSYPPWYAYKSQIKKITVSNDITVIGEYVFYMCSNLTEVSLPDTVTEIRKDAFKGCSALKSFTFPSQVTELSRHLFHDCTGLEKVTLPAGLKTVNNNAFRNCTSLEKVTFKGTEQAWSNIRFVYDNSDEKKMLLGPKYEYSGGQDHKCSFTLYSTDGATNTRTAKCDTEYCYNSKTEKYVNVCTHYFLYFVFNDDEGYYENGTETAQCWAGCGATKTQTRENSMLIDSTKKFTDVKKGKWYVYYIDYAVGKGMFSGTSDTKFSPETPITRAMFVSVLSRIAGVDVDNKSNTKFTDVPKNKWFTGAVKWASEKGITSGTSATTFEPNRNITRQEICKMLVSYSDRVGILLEENTSPTTFKDDKTIAGWAYKDVYTCQTAGLVSGDNVGNFNPKKSASRAEVATILTQYYKNFLRVRYEPLYGGSADY